VADSRTAQRGQKKSSSNGNDPRARLSDEFHNLLSAVAGKVGDTASGQMGSLTDKLTDFADGGGNGGGAKKAAAAKAGEKVAEGKSPVKAALSAGAEGIKDKVSGAFGGGGGGGGKGGKRLKVTNIIEEIDIGAPVRLVYDQWTQFQEFSEFMKKVESVDQKEDTKVEFKAQVLWSHRQWTATILEQVPDKRIVWRSSGEKGHVDGAVTFHEIAPELTRVVVVLEYYPQGLFERTGNLWRAQGRRVRLELKHFRRHVMTEDLLHRDDVDGWRGEIHDGKVARSPEEVEEEEDQDDDYEDSAEDEQADDGEDEDEADDGEYEDEYDDEDEDEEPEEDEEEEEPEEDEEADDGEYEDEYDDDEYDDEAEDDEAEDDERPARRRKR
jgi:hypothetical protein